MSSQYTSDGRTYLMGLSIAFEHDYRVGRIRQHRGVQAASSRAVINQFREVELAVECLGQVGTQKWSLTKHAQPVKSPTSARRRMVIARFVVSAKTMNTKAKELPFGRPYIYSRRGTLPSGIARCCPVVLIRHIARLLLRNRTHVNYTLHHTPTWLTLMFDRIKRFMWVADDCTGAQ